MNIYRVNDASFDEVAGAQYDAIFVASGYEQRCTCVSKRLNPKHFRNVAILAFNALTDSPERIEHDGYLQSRWGTEQRELSAEDESPLYDLLRDLSARGGHLTKILVDYSSMSRLWYAAILNWARYASGSKELTIDFAYAIGVYEENGPPMIIQDMLAVPGCEGGALRLEKSVAIFGLGFNGWASLCVLERLEADLVYAFLASPAADDRYPAQVLEKNQDFLEETKTHEKVLKFPLRSVEGSYRYLSELIAPHRGEDIITLVPMGPKPHVLASILVSMRFPEVSCLRISAKRERPENVAPTGEIMVTRVIVRH